MIDYKDIMYAGYELLREDVNTLYGCDDNDKAEAAVHMGGIIDMVWKLKELYNEVN